MRSDAKSWGWAGARTEELVIVTSDCRGPGGATNSHDGGDAARRLRCTHLSLDNARGKHPERVQRERTINEGRRAVAAGRIRVMADESRQPINPHPVRPQSHPPDIRVWPRSCAIVQAQCRLRGWCRESRWMRWRLFSDRSPRRDVGPMAAPSAVYSPGWKAFVRGWPASTRHGNGSTRGTR